jgi:hypothetical protein
MSTRQVSAAKAQPNASRLTERQRKFADLWVKARSEGIKLTNAEIAKAAGYGGNSEAVLYIQASDCLASPAVREYLQAAAKQILMDGQVGAATTLAALSTRAESERVRGDMAHKLLVGTGLLASDQAQMGAAPIALQVVFRQQDGSDLASTPQVIDVAADVEPPHSLGEGEGEATPPPGGRGKRAQATGAGSKTRAKSLAPPSHTISSSKRRGGKR